MDEKPGVIFTTRHVTGDVTMPHQYCRCAAAAAAAAAVTSRKQVRREIPSWVLPTWTAAGFIGIVRKKSVWCKNQR